PSSLARLPLALARPLAPLAGLQVAFGLRLGAAAARSAVVFGSPHPLEDLGQPEIDLPALHVDLDHLHADAIAEAIDPAGVLAAQHMLLLDEAVVVVGHRRHVDHALD